VAKRLIKSLKYWLPIGFITTCLIGLIYLSVQQDLRIGANDPQIQMSEDAATNLSQGVPIQSVITTPSKIDLSKSLAPFLIVYDDSGNPIASSGELDNQTPKLPKGVLDFARSNKQDKFTWQPENGVRVAAVITRFEGYQKGFVLSGRSLREVEKRESQLSVNTFAAWVVTMVGSLLLSFIFVI